MLQKQVYMKKPLLTKYLISLSMMLLFAFSALAYADSDNINKHSTSLNESETWAFSDSSGFEFMDIDPEQKPGFYPNPARNTIHLTHQENVARVRIISLTGKTIIDIKIKSESINLSHLSQGMYLINFDMKDGKRIASKLVKK